MASPRALFIADLHLTADIGPRHFALRDFLARWSTRDEPPALFILGDLFDYWCGPGSEDAPGNRFVLLCLQRAAREGLQIYFQGGNRDFLLDSSVLARFGVECLDPSAAVRLGALSVRVMHGDSLLLADRAHLCFRWILRSALVRELVHLLPAGMTEGLARQIRRRSRGSSEMTNGDGCEVPAAAVARLLRSGDDVVVCGHLHRADERRIEVDGRDCHFFVLGSWEEEASVLVLDDGEFRFESFPIGPADGAN